MFPRLTHVLPLFVLASAPLASTVRAQSTRVEKRDEARSAGSAGARSDKQFGVGGRAGLLMGGIPGGGIEGFYALSPSFQLGAFAGAGEIDLADDIVTSSSIEINEAKVSVQVAQITGKYFIGNSFSASVGLGYRQIDLSVDVESVYGHRLATTFDVHGPYSLIAIGNTWTWASGFYLGTDWVGIAYPFANESKAETTGREMPDESLRSVQRNQEELAEDMRKQPILTALMLHLGVMF